MTWSKPPWAASAAASASAIMPIQSVRRLVMVMSGWFMGGVLAFQKFLFFLFFFEIVGAFRVQLLHLLALFEAQVRKVADEANQFPGIFGIVTARSSPTRHSGEPDAVL